MPQLSGGLGTAASICVMIVVIGCFSVLWSFIYYPMLKSWRGNEPDHTGKCLFTASAVSN